MNSMPTLSRDNRLKSPRVRIERPRPSSDMIDRWTRREQEMRATSALLAVAGSVREFGSAILRPLGAPAGSISTFIEVQFELADGRKVRPDGVIRVSRVQEPGLVSSRSRPAQPILPTNKSRPILTLRGTTGSNPMDDQVHRAAASIGADVRLSRNQDDFPV
jgi:hypothetical protein